MAPLKSGAAGSGKITSFFSRFTIPKKRRPDPNAVEEEILVASPSRSPSIKADAATRRESQNSGSSPRASSQSDALTPRKRGCPPKSATTSSSPLSGSDSLNRGRGRPPKCASDSPANRGSKTQNKRSAGSHSTATSHASPTRFNVNPLSGAQDVTPTKDSPYRSSSTSSSKRRRVLLGSPSMHPTAPSPLSVRTKSPRNVAPTKAPAFTKPLSMSASFASSLSSVPLSSVPTSTTTSSKRVMKDGMKGIANSDSDDSSSGEDLAPVSSFFANKRRKLSPSVEKKEGTQLVNAPHSWLLDQGQRKNFDRGMVESAPKKVYKNSLANIAKQHAAWKKSAESIAGMEAAVQDSKKRQEEAITQDDSGQHVNAQAMIDNAEDDESKERMAKALERTEALNTARLYHFFLDTRSQFDDTEFPRESLSEPWAQLLTDDAARARAFVSGFATQLVERCPLPLAVTNWMAHQLTYEKSGALCEAYVDILTKSSRHHPETISDTIASISSIYKTRSLFELNLDQGCASKGLPSGLRYYLQVVRYCAPATDAVVKAAPPSWTAAAFLDLAMINIDENVKADLDLSLTVDACIESMLDNLEDDHFDMLIPAVISTLYDSHLPPNIRCRIITSLPARSVRAYHIRRRLALQQFSVSKDRKLADDQDWFACIIKTVRSKPEFDVTRPNTDYNFLMTLVQLVDIAASAGFTPWDELHPPQDLMPQGPFAKAPPLSEAARSHNRNVDLLVIELQNVHGRIHDSGVNHLGRTEVKSALERLMSRLEHTVRTKPKPKKSVFGNKPQLTQTKFAKKLLANATVIDEKRLARMQSPSVNTAGSPAWSGSSTPPPYEQLPTPKGSVDGVDQEMQDAPAGSNESSTDDSEEQEFQTCPEIS